MSGGFLFLFLTRLRKRRHKQHQPNTYSLSAVLSCEVGSEVRLDTYLRAYAVVWHLCRSDATHVFVKNRIHKQNN